MKAILLLLIIIAVLLVVMDIAVIYAAREVEKKKENYLKIEGAEVMKGVILKTDDGIKLFGCLQYKNEQKINKINIDI